MAFPTFFRLSHDLTDLCLSVSCQGVCQQWPAATAEALGAAYLGVAYALLEEVGVSPTVDVSELTQDWGNILLEGTNKNLCIPGPRIREQ